MIQYQKLNRQIMRQKSSRRNKSRMVWSALLILWVTWISPFKKGGDILYKVTAQILPLITYEQEYGMMDIDYAADYQVPEWFYEDEGQSTAAGEMAETEGEGLAQNQSLSDGENPGDAGGGGEKITTLADGAVGTTYTRDQLASRDFLLSKIFVVDSNTSMTAEELDLANLLDVDLSVPELKAWSQQADKTEKQYKILIYHTHASESFADSEAGNQEDTIVGVGSYLTELLEEEYGIPVYHDTTAYDVIDGVLDRSRAYENAYNSVSKTLKENPSIEVVIDLHRDGVDEETHLVTDINGKRTAKVMFLNGVSRSNTNGEIEYLKNPNKLSNLAFSFQMYLAGKEYYGDYVRKIYVKSLRFNLHLLPRASLIEVGAQNNTVEEEKNAMEPLAAILNQVLSDEE